MSLLIGRHAKAEEQSVLSLFRNARFERSAARPDQLPPPVGPEVAFAGRSNSGKSSAINVLVGHKGLARVSRTPGRTQLINFFRVGPGQLVDLPGYGYAEVPERLRTHWRPLIEHYLRTRTALRGLVLVMDARHPFTPVDRQLLDWFALTGKPVHILLTKSDKLSRGEAILALRHAEQELSSYPVLAAAHLFSASKPTGVQEGRRRIAEWMDVQQSI